MAPTGGVDLLPSSPRVGASCLDIFLPEDRPALKAALEARSPTRLLLHARRRAGDAGAFDAIIEPKDDGGAAILLIDRTDDVRVRDSLSRSLGAARAEARASASALADLSHEMKTPLNAVIGFADTLRAETFGPVGHPRYAEYAEHIHSSGNHLLDLVKAILDLARIEADRLSLSPVLADPNKLAGECAAMVRQAAEATGLRLVVETDEATPECALDPRAVRQILINLLTNAVKFTSDGEVRLSVATEGTDGADERAGERIVFTVADTGIGMDKAALDKLGPRFTDAQGLGVRGADGAGLGLSLAFKLAELHGGALKLSSAPGEGVTARLELPLDRTGAMRRPGFRASRPEAAATAAQPALTALERIEARRRAARKADAEANVEPNRGANREAAHEATDAAA